MSQQVTITSVTANTPVEIYYCDSTSGSCVYVSTVSVFPYTFDVPPPYDEEDIVIKIIDTQSCEDGIVIPITPTPTVTQTSTPAITPSITPTTTLTPTNTASVSPTITSSPTNTPTFTPSPTATPVVVAHPIGYNVWASSATTCFDTITLNNYYTYIAQANLVPVIGVTVYQTVVNGVLYNPYNGGDRYILMGWGGNFYVVKINSQGQIVEYSICSNLTTPTPTITNTPTNTATPTNTGTIPVTPTTTQTSTPTNTITNTQTPSVSPTNTSTPTVTPSVSPTNTSTPTVTPSVSPTNTNTPTVTPSVTHTPTSSPLPPCYTVTINITNNSSTLVSGFNLNGANATYLSGNTFPLSVGQSNTVTVPFSTYAGVNAYVYLQFPFTLVYGALTDSDGHYLCSNNSLGSQIPYTGSNVFGNCSAPMSVVVTDTPC